MRHPGLHPERSDHGLIAGILVAQKVKAAGQSQSGGPGGSGSLPMNRTRIRRPGGGAGSTAWVVTRGLDSGVEPATTSLLLLPTRETDR